MHFHVVDRNAAIDAEGIPYVFEFFELEAAGELLKSAFTPVGNSLELDASGIAKWRTEPALHRERELPMRNSIVEFSD